MKNKWYTVHGAFVPTPQEFDDEEEALQYAKDNTNDWAKDVSVVKSETIWRSSEEG